MGLAEVLVAVALLSIVIAGTTSLFSNMTDMVSKVSIQQAANSLVLEMQTLTMSQVTCSRSLVANQSFDLTNASQLRIDPTTGKFNVSANAGSDIRMRLSSGEVLFPSSEKLTSYPLVVKTLKLYGATHTGDDSTGTPIYKVDLVGSFVGLTGGIEIGLAPRLLSTFFIRVDASNNIVDCFNLNPFDNTGLSDELLCSKVGGIYEDGSCNTIGPTCEALGGTFENGSCTGVGGPTGTGGVGGCPSQDVSTGNQWQPTFTLPEGDQGEIQLKSQTSGRSECRQTTTHYTFQCSNQSWRFISRRIISSGQDDCSR